MSFGIMSSPQQFSLRWNNYLRHITLAFGSLRSQEDLVDVTLSCEGRKIRAHKVLLSACSLYFRDIFKENPCQHPVIIFKNVKYEDLSAIIEFMYQGEVNVVQESLPSFLNTAELLSVQGLTENSSKEDLLVDGNIIPALNINTNPSSSFYSSKVLPVSFEASNTYETKHSSTSDTPDENTLEFIHTDMKIEIPEFIDIPESNNVKIQTNEEVSHIMHDPSFENPLQSDESMKENNYKSDIEAHLQNQDMTTLEMDSSEMRKIFSSQNSVDTSRVQDFLPQNKWSQCQFCKLVITSVNLWRHVRTQHTSQPPRRCEHCKKTFKNKYSLREHVRMAHEHKPIPTKKY